MALTLASAATLVVLGLLIGSFGTLIGAGGGFLLMPLLLLGYHLPAPTAVGTSLSLVFINAASGSLAYLRLGRVDLSLGWKFAAATIPGAIGGAHLTRALSSEAFDLVFGGTVALISALLFSGISVAPSRRGDVRRLVDVGGEAYHYHVDVWKGLLVSFLAGFVSSVLGIGGGIIHVPFLIVALSLPVHVATATSQFVLSISALVGALTFLWLGSVDLRITALLGAGILVGAQVGARASLRAGSTMIRRLLAVSLALVGLRMALRGLGIG